MTNTSNYPYLSQVDDLDRFVKATTARALALETVTAKHAEFTDAKAQRTYAAQRLTVGNPDVLLRTAGKERRLRRPAAEFDREAHLVGCANGVLDLRTGELHTGRRDLLVSRSTGITYDPNARCPRWEQFVSEVLPASDEAQAAAGTGAARGRSGG